MNVVFMGTPDFAVKTLELLAKNHTVLAVVTQPDKPKGRGKKLVPPPVKEKAQELGIEVLQPENAKDLSFVENLKKYVADIFVVAAYGQILTEAVLDMPKYGSVNVHGSLLPAYRGAGPIQWAIINGHKETGVTIMQMSKGLDSGHMISKEVITINSDHTYGTLSEEMANVGANLLLKTLKDIEDGTAVKEEQNHSIATYAPMITKETEHMNWEKTSYEISCLVRGLNPQPGAYTVYKEEVFKIWSVEILSEKYENAHCGEIVGITKKGFIVKTLDGAVLILLMQAKGGKIMPTDAYMRGHAVEKGVVLK